jgi:vacuolar-type H+-ATPase subunit F/Vma7
MSYQVRAIARPEVATGLALAGVRPTEAAAPEQGADHLKAMLAAPEVGVVLIEENVYGCLPEDLRRRISKRPLPMVVPFPGPTWQELGEGPEAYIVELLRQVIGYRVRLR